MTYTTTQRKSTELQNYLLFSSQEKSSAQSDRVCSLHFQTRAFWKVEK
jgi:hypothetical protein